MRSLITIFVCCALSVSSAVSAENAPANPKPMETLRAPTIDFISEQDGEFERMVKDLLVPALIEHKEIKSAYLVAVVYNRREQGVALCLELSDHRSEQEIAKKVSTVFAKIAGAAAHLDVIFLAAEQLQKVRAVATAFYVGS